MRQRFEILLLPLVTIAIVLSSSTMAKQVYFPSIGEEDSFALIFLSFLFFLSFTIFSMRHEIVDIIRELFRREDKGFTGSKRNFIFSFLLNLILLLGLLLLIGRSPRETAPQTYFVQEPSYNQSLTGNYTAQSQQAQEITGQRLTTGGTLYRYTPTIIILTIMLTSLSIILAFRGGPAREAVEPAVPLQTKLLRETRVALENLKTSKDARAIIIELYNSLCRELRLRKVRVDAEMTAREIMKETLNLIPYLPRKPLENLTFLFEKALYSNHEVLSSDKEEAEKSLAEIIRSLEQGTRNDEDIYG